MGWVGNIWTHLFYEHRLSTAYSQWISILLCLRWKFKHFSISTLAYQHIFCTFPSGLQIERPRTRPPRAGRGHPCHCTLCPPPSPETWNICTTPILVASVLHQVHQANSPAPDFTYVLSSYTWLHLHLHLWAAPSQQHTWSLAHLVKQEVYPPPSSHLNNDGLLWNTMITKNLGSTFMDHLPIVWLRLLVRVTKCQCD